MCSAGKAGGQDAALRNDRSALGGAYEVNVIGMSSRPSSAISSLEQEVGEIGSGLGVIWISSSCGLAKVVCKSVSASSGPESLRRFLSHI